MLALIGLSNTFTPVTYGAEHEKSAISYSWEVGFNQGHGGWHGASNILIFEGKIFCAGLINDGLYKGDDGVVSLAPMIGVTRPFYEGPRWNANISTLLSAGSFERIKENESESTELIFRGSAVGLISIGSPWQLPFLLSPSLGASIGIQKTVFGDKPPWNWNAWLSLKLKWD